MLDKFVNQLLVNSGHRYHYSWFKLPEIRYVVDAALTIDRYVKGWMEVKCRSGKPDQYTHWFISLHKLMKGLSLHDYTGLPFFILFDWDGQSFAARVEDPPRTALEWGGREDRSDSEDTEPVVLIPRAWFKPIGLGGPVDFSSKPQESPTPPPACAVVPKSPDPGPNVLII